MPSTSEERIAATGGVAVPTFPGVTPDSAKGSDWRQQAAGTYSGIGFPTDAARVLDFSATAKKFYRTASQDAIPRADAGSHGISFWFYVPETVSSAQTILHGDTDGADS